MSVSEKPYFRDDYYTRLSPSHLIVKIKLNIEYKNYICNPKLLIYEFSINRVLEIDIQIIIVLLLQGVSTSKGYSFKDECQDQQGVSRSPVPI